MYPLAPLALSKAYRKDERKDERRKRVLKPLRKKLEAKLATGKGHHEPYRECKGLQIHEFKHLGKGYRAYLAEQHGTWLLLAIEPHDYHFFTQKCKALASRLRVG